MTETVSGVFETAFVVLFGVCETVSSVWSEPQADNRLTARVEARSIGINFFFINPPGIRSVSYLTYAGIKNR